MPGASGFCGVVTRPSVDFCGVVSLTSGFCGVVTRPADVGSTGSGVVPGFGSGVGDTDADDVSLRSGVGVGYGCSVIGITTSFDVVPRTADVKAVIIAVVVIVSTNVFCLICVVVFVSGSSVGDVFFNVWVDVNTSVVSANVF